MLKTLTDWIQKISKQKATVITLGLFFILSFPAIKDMLLPHYFPMHDDLQILRLKAMDDCIMDRQIPCRWIKDAGFGYGYPMFNYYPPLPYYVAEGLHLLGMDYFWSIKITFVLSFILSGLFMFALLRRFVSNAGALTGALFYVWAPYHSVDVYVRGAMNEAWGLTFFPLILFALYDLVIKKTKSSFLLFAISLACLLTSHNVMTLIFAPIAIAWCLFWIYQQKDYEQIIPVALSGLLGVGLSAFFFIPVALESKLVHVESMTVGYFNYLAHFTDFKQLFFSRFWGYGGSTWGPEDDMAFPVGHLHWIIALVIMLIATYLFVKKRTKTSVQNLLITLSFFIIGFGYAFLTHSRAVWFWDNLPLLYYAQFPWRLLAIPALAFSFLAGYLFVFLKKSWHAPLAAVLILGVIAINLPFFRIERQVRVSYPEKISGALWELQTTGGIFDYLPKSATRPPGDAAIPFPVYIEGTGSSVEFKRGTNWLSFTGVVATENATLRLPIFEYPKTTVRVGGKVIDHTYDKDLGRVIINLPKGEHKVFVQITNTPIRTFSNILTVISFLILIYILTRKNAHKL